MSAIPNTIRRSGVYHFRRVIPAGLRDQLSRGELTCSLHTHDAADARMLSRCLYLRSEELFGVLRGASVLSDQDIAALVQDFYATLLAKDTRDRLMNDLPEPEALRLAKVEHYRLLSERSRIDLASNAFASVELITEAMLARRFGADARFDKPSVRRVQQAMLRAGAEVSETLRARAEGDFNYEPRDKLLVAALAEAPAMAPAAPAAATPPVAATADVPAAIDGLAFSVEANRFRETQLRRKIWEHQTYLQARKTYALFLECLGDRPLAAFTRRDAAAFKSLLEDLPANYGKAAEYRGMTARDC